MSLLLTRHEAHPFMGMDVPWLLEQRALTRRDHPFIVWVPFDGAARSLQLRPVPRTRAAHRRRPARARRAPRRARADPPGQLRRGPAGLVRLHLARRGGGDHQCPRRRRRAGLLRRAQRRGGRHHPAALRRAGGRALHRPEAGWRSPPTDNGAPPPHPHRAQPAISTRSTPSRCRAARPTRWRRAACSTPRAPPRGPRACCGPMPTRCGARASTRVHEDLRAERRAPGAPAAVPHQRPGLFGAGLLWAGATAVVHAALLGQPLLARVAGAPLHLDLDGARSASRR